MNENDKIPYLKENKVGFFIQFDFKIYFKTKVIKVVLS